MAYDKLVDSSQLDSDLTSVANAIRTKGGTSSSLLFPSGFVSAINNISTGGGGSYLWYGPNTVKDYTKTITINLKDDTSWDSWTASTTSASILAAPTTADFTYSYNRSLDVIWVVCTAITNYTLTSNATKSNIPISTGRVDWAIVFGRPNTYAQYQDLQGGTHTYKTIYDTYMYYYNTSGIKSATTTNYGAYVSAAPNISQSASGSTITISVKRGAINARCSSTSFSTSRKADIDSANTNIVITFNVYKTPRENTFIVNNLNDLWTAMNAAPEA